MKNFFEKETACPCCGVDKTDPRLLCMINNARYSYGKPIKANSIYRCEKHNIEVDGVAGSSHTKGYAIDIQLNNKGKDTLALVPILLSVGFKRLVLYKSKNIIHADIDETKPEGIFIR